MGIQGRAIDCIRLLDKRYQIIDWELADDAGVRLAKGMVREAKKNGGRYSRKLVWFWGAAKNIGWDEDEIAWWILDGSWHELKMGQDLTEVF